MITAASILIGSLMAWLLFRFFFDDFGDFMERVRFWITPDIVSMFQGEWLENEWASTKLFIYVGLCVGSGIGTYFGPHKLFV
jgi:hypothetical protein